MATERLLEFALAFAINQVTNNDVATVYTLFLAVLFPTQTLTG